MFRSGHECEHAEPEDQHHPNGCKQEYIEEEYVTPSNTFTAPWAMMIPFQNAKPTVRTMRYFLFIFSMNYFAFHTYQIFSVFI